MMGSKLFRSAFILEKEKMLEIKKKKKKQEVTFCDLMLTVEIHHVAALLPSEG